MLTNILSHILGEDVKKAVGDEVSFPQDKEQEQRLNLTVRGECMI